jgi:glycosyltransferase involved in cell wall biosynthesis
MKTYGIVISSYKYGHLAAHAVESVLSQSPDQFDKIWFVDDGAGDCQHIKDLYGDRLNFVQHQTNKGIVDNFNDMLNRVDTDYVMFLGADNWLRSDALFLIRSRVFSNEPQPDIIVYDIMVTGELKLEIYRIYHHQMSNFQGDFFWKRDGQHHGSMMYNVKMAKSVGGYAHNRTSNRTDEDLNLWEKMLKAGAKVNHLSQPLLHYRRHRENFNKY